MIKTGYYNVKLGNEFYKKKFLHAPVSDDFHLNGLYHSRRDYTIRMSVGQSIRSALENFVYVTVLSEEPDPHRPGTTRYDVRLNISALEIIHASHGYIDGDTLLLNTADILRSLQPEEDMIVGYQFYITEQDPLSRVEAQGYMDIIAGIRQEVIEKYYRKYVTRAIARNIQYINYHHFNTGYYLRGEAV